jgi:hypothetical protein
MSHHHAQNSDGSSAPSFMALGVHVKRMENWDTGRDSRGSSTWEP